jgi:multidrug efflux pump subunit AcrA (membrane-fusion protein)
MGETLDLLAFTELLPEKQAQIMARFKGRVTELFVQVGQAVKKGQPLLTVDPIIQSNRPVTLHSPIDGFVLSQNSVPGLVVAEGDSMMLIGDASQILVRGVGYETPAIQRLSVGQPVEVHLDIAPEVPLHGSIQRTNLQLDPITRTFSVYALIETPGEDFLPNLQGTMEVQLSEPSPRLTVPRRALVGDDGNYAVYVLEGDRAERRPVELGIHNGTHVEIIHGVLPDEEVITQGSYQLQYVPGTANAGHDAVHPDHKEHDHTDHTHDEGHKHDGEQGE